MENNASHYEPEHWELWYRASYPYLKNVPASVLFDRHELIATNLKVFWSEERQKISIRNVFSAWYWLRKEHQVRLEMDLRGLSPRLNIVLPLGEIAAPARPRRPNFGDVLFRFSKTEWLVRTLREGHLWINEGTTFLNPALGSARADDELKKTRNFLAERTRLTLRGGREILAPSDVTWHVEGPPYFLFSTSSDFIHICSMRLPAAMRAWSFMIPSPSWIGSTPHWPPLTRDGTSASIRCTTSTLTSRRPPTKSCTRSHRRTFRMLSKWSGVSSASLPGRIATSTLSYFSDRAMT